MSLRVGPLNQIKPFSSCLQASQIHSKEISTLNIDGELLLSQHQTRYLMMNYMPLIKILNCIAWRSYLVLEHLSKGWQTRTNFKNYLLL